jgi:predicted ATPase
LSRSERVFQVNAPGLQGQFGPLRSVEAFPGNLPLPVSSLIGREREIDRTIEALAEARVVTLTGVGGVGKTRLAHQVAALAMTDFEDGAWLVELAPVRDADGVVEVVAGVFGVTARVGVTVEDVMVEFFRSKRLLLVLDNCEHVLEAVAEFVERLERSCPGVVVLATSREPLVVDGERVYGVRSLGTPRSDADVAEIAGAVRRARACP